jgi:hypothetical protein
MSHRYKPKEKINVESVISEKCRQCKIGQIQLENFLAYHETETISKKEFMQKSKEMALTCCACIHMGMKGTKAYIAKKVIPNFQSLDLFQPIGE